MKSFWWVFAIAAFCQIAQGFVDASTDSKNNTQTIASDVLDAGSSHGKAVDKSMNQSFLQNSIDSSDIQVNISDNEVLNKTFTDDYKNGTIPVPSGLLTNAATNVFTKMNNGSSLLGNASDFQKVRKNNETVYSSLDISNYKSSFGKRKQSATSSPSINQTSIDTFHKSDGPNKSMDFPAKILQKFPQLKKGLPKMIESLINIYNADVDDQQPIKPTINSQNEGTSETDKLTFNQYEKTSSPFTRKIPQVESSSYYPPQQGISRLPYVSKNNEMKNIDDEVPSKAQSQQISYEEDYPKTKNVRAEWAPSQTVLSKIPLRKADQNSAEDINNIPKIISLKNNENTSETSSRENTTELSDQSESNKVFLQPPLDTSEEDTTGVKHHRHVNFTHVYRHYSLSDEQSSPNFERREAPDTNHQFSSNDHIPESQLPFNTEKIEQDQEQKTKVAPGLHLIRVPVWKFNPTTSKKPQERVFHDPQSPTDIPKRKHYGPDDETFGYHTSFYESKRKHAGVTKNTSPEAPNQQTNGAKPQTLVQKYLLYPMIQKLTTDPANANNPNSDSENIVLLKNGGIPTHEIVISHQIPETNGHGSSPPATPQISFKPEGIPNFQGHIPNNHPAGVYVHPDMNQHQNIPPYTSNGANDNGRIHQFPPIASEPAIAGLQRGKAGNNAVFPINDGIFTPPHRNNGHNLYRAGAGSNQISQSSHTVQNPSISHNPQRVQQKWPTNGQPLDVQNRQQYNGQQTVSNRWKSDATSGQRQHQNNRVNQNNINYNNNNHHDGRQGLNNNFHNVPKPTQGNSNQNDQQILHQIEKSLSDAGEKVVECQFAENDNRQTQHGYGNNVQHRGPVQRNGPGNFPHIHHNVNGNQHHSPHRNFHGNHHPTAQHNDNKNIAINANHHHYSTQHNNNNNINQNHQHHHSAQHKEENNVNHVRSNPAGPVLSNLKQMPPTNDPNRNDKELVQYVEIYAPQGNNISHLLLQDGEYYVVYKDETDEQNTKEGEQHAQENRNMYDSYGSNSEVLTYVDKIRNSVEYLQNTPSKNVAAVGVHLVRSLAPQVPPTKSIKSKLSFGVEVVRGHEHPKSL